MVDRIGWDKFDVEIIEKIIHSVNNIIYISDIFLITSLQVEYHVLVRIDFLDLDF